MVMIRAPYMPSTQHARPMQDADGARLSHKKIPGVVHATASRPASVARKLLSEGGMSLGPFATSTAPAAPTAKAGVAAPRVWSAARASATIQKKARAVAQSRTLKICAELRQSATDTLQRAVWAIQAPAAEMERFAAPICMAITVAALKAASVPSTAIATVERKK